MPDPYAKVSPGQEVTFNSSVWNDMLSAGRAERDRQRSLTSESSGAYRQGSIIRVKNSSGTDLLRNSILGLQQPIFLPASNLEAFKDEVQFSAITPVAASKGKFVILLEPIGDGRVGRAAIAGVCQVKVNIINAIHKCADIVAGNTDNLETLATGGSAQLLWVEGVGTGITWAVVRFGNRCVV